MNDENTLGRRKLLAAAALAFVSGCVQSRVRTVADNSPLVALETQIGGRVGVAAVDTGSGMRLSHRGDERFAMCSTFKWTLAAAVLSKVDRGELALDRRVPYGAPDLLSNSPVTTAHVGEGAMSVESLCECIIEVSDNTSANLLLTLIGGPAGLTQYLRTQGDLVTRLDRNELSLNTNIAGDVLDTTTPNAMVETMNTLLVGDALSDNARNKLIGWLKNSRTGLARIRAGLPPGWIAGDKTGTGANGAVNDVAILWPPKRAPILVAVYLSESRATTEALSTAHATIGGIVATQFA